MLLYDLDCIKPKRQNENLQAILSDGFCILDFGDTLIYKKDPSIKYKLATISHKDLFTYQYNNAQSIESYNMPFNIELDRLEYEEITINADDATFFSSISAAGEDLFFLGQVGWNRRSLISFVSGLIYFIINQSTKVSYDMSSSLIKTESHYIGYQVFYYLFQMFKNLSGKKTDTLLIAKEKDILYLTNQNRDYYIISLTPSEYKRKNFNIINKFYIEQKFNKETHLFRKDYIQDKDSFIKHLSRPLGETIIMHENQAVYKLSANQYDLFINKEK